MRKYIVFISLAGAAAGIVNGLFGAGGGMILVPLLGLSTHIEDNEIFPMSISIILPLSIVSLFIQSGGILPWNESLPYLYGSAIGGILAGLLGKYIPIQWLHRILGILIIWGGVKFLW